MKHVRKVTARPKPLLATRICDLGLSIEGSWLGPVVEEFKKEVRRAGLTRLEPHVFLGDEWGVEDGTVSIAIPFYLAHPDLIALHAEREGFVEGASAGDLLRYLRHEMGHVVNYAYKLYDDEKWKKLFGDFLKEYEEEYEFTPFSVCHVRHLPGWYAQKHPDEDWAETFAVWMTPGFDWRTAYADWPEALEKLKYCDRAMKAVRNRPPAVTARVEDDSLSWMTETLEERYAQEPPEDEKFLPGLDGALQNIFEAAGAPEDLSSTAKRLPAADLIRRVELDIVANVFRWTGYFPERTRPLIRHLADRARKLKQVYPADREATATVALTTLVTSWAMHRVNEEKQAPKS